MTSDPDRPDNPDPPRPDPDPGDGPPAEELPFAEEIADIPVVVPVGGPGAPPPRPRRPVPHPNLGWAILWNLGFAAVVFGSIIGLVLAAMVVLIVADDPAVKAAPATPNQIPRPLADVLAVGFVIAYVLGLIFSVIALRAVAGRDWPRQVGLRRPPAVFVLLTVVGLPGFVLISDGLARLLVSVFGNPESLNQDEVLRDVFGPFPWWFAVLAIGVCPGVVEEVWCRGFLGRGLIGRHGWAAGVVVTSLFFGLLHIFPPWYVIVTGAMGVGLHLVYLASRSLWIPILLHTLNNSLAALGMIRVLHLDRVDRNAQASPALVYLLALGLLAFVGVAMWTARVRVVPKDPDAPAWEPPFPGVAHPPPGANAVLRPGRVSGAAVVMAVVVLGVLVYVLTR
jgi:membrane protease YdiL (CAAX protease family)